MGKRAGRTNLSVNSTEVRSVAKRVWIWLVILTAIICLYPVEYRITRLALVAGAALVWAGALIGWWQRRALRFTLIGVAALAALAVCLPGRAADPDLLAKDYGRGLRCFRGVRYVWGGEGFLGIDCSGLVRQGMIWGQVYYGLCALNGGPIRQAIDIWWHDCSAMALRDGYRGWTTELFRQDGVANADYTRLKPGDLAVTADGVHVMAYIGNHTWIEADPVAQKVIEVALPTDNQWFKIPVVFVRWKWLSAEPPNTSRRLRTASARQTMKVRSSGRLTLRLTPVMGKPSRLGHPEATLRLSGSQPVGTLKPPSVYPQATLRLPRAGPAASLRWALLPELERTPSPKRRVRRSLSGRTRKFA